MQLIAQVGANTPSFDQEEGFRVVANYNAKFRH